MNRSKLSDEPDADTIYILPPGAGERIAVLVEQIVKVGYTAALDPEAEANPTADVYARLRSLPL